MNEEWAAYFAQLKKLREDQAEALEQRNIAIFRALLEGQPMTAAGLRYGCNAKAVKTICREMMIKVLTGSLPTPIQLRKNPGDWPALLDAYEAKRRNEQ